MDSRAISPVVYVSPPERESADTTPAEARPAEASPPEEGEAFGALSEEGLAAFSAGRWGDFADTFGCCTTVVADASRRPSLEGSGARAVCARGSNALLAVEVTAVE